MSGGLAPWQWVGIGALGVAFVAMVPLVAMSRSAPAPSSPAPSSSSSRPTPTSSSRTTPTSPASAFEWAGTYEWTCLDDPSKPRLLQNNDSVTLKLDKLHTHGFMYIGTIRHGYGTWQGKPAYDEVSVTASAEGDVIYVSDVGTPERRFVLRRAGAELVTTSDACAFQTSSPIVVKKR